MAKEKKSWEGIKENLNKYTYACLFIATVFLYIHSKSLRLYHESFVDVKLIIDQPPVLKKGKNSYISFKANGIKKEFEIRSGALNFTKINTITTKIAKNDSVKIKISYDDFFDINRDLPYNNFNEIFGFNFKGEELIEYKKAIKAEDNANLMVLYLSLWAGLCCQIYKRFEIEPILDLTWCIFIGFFLILMYYKDVANDLASNF